MNTRKHREIKRATTIDRSACPPEQQMTPNSELGFCTSIFGHRHSLTAAKLAALAATGLPWVEISALQSLHLDMYDSERVTDLVTTMAALPMKVWSLHAPFCGLAMDDAETRQDALRLLRQTIAVAKRFSARVIVVHPGRDVPTIDRRRELAWMRDALMAVQQELPQGLQLAVETMGPQSPAGHRGDLIELLDGLDPARVGICLDTGHTHLSAADVAAAIDELAGRIITVHIHDNMGDRDAHAMPGQGNIQWPTTLAALRRGGYHGPLICEGDDERLSAAEAVAAFQRWAEQMEK